MSSGVRVLSYKPMILEMIKEWISHIIDYYNGVLESYIDSDPNSVLIHHEVMLKEYGL